MCRTIRNCNVASVFITSFLLKSQRLPHGCLFFETLLVEQLSSQTKRLLCELRNLVDFSCFPLSVPLHFVHAHAKALLVAFHVLMLRLSFREKEKLDIREE